MRFRTHLSLLGAVVLLAACGADDTDTATDVPDAEEAPELEDAPPAEGEAPDDGAILADLGITVDDGVARGAGVVLPIPDGWELDPGAATQGTLLAIPDPVDPQAILLGVAGIEDDPASGFEGVDLDGALDVVRSTLPDEPERDEEVSIAGAERAQLLVFPSVEGDPEMGAPPAYQALILAEDADGALALFNYVAAEGSEDEAIVDLLLSEAGFDPDSEPFEPQPAPDFGDLGDLDELTEEDLEELQRELEGELEGQLDDPEGDDQS